MNGKQNEWQINQLNPENQKQKMPQKGFPFGQKQFFAFYFLLG
jgi:hypothetical protein